MNDGVMGYKKVGKYKNIFFLYSKIDPPNISHTYDVKLKSL